MGNPVNPAQAAVWQALPNANVQYVPETQTLYIGNGQPARMGDEIAKWVVVFTDEDPEAEDQDAAANVAAIQIDAAESVLKPFVDAILAKYGIHTEDTPPAASKSALAPDRPNESPITPTPKHAR